LDGIGIVAVEIVETGEFVQNGYLLLIYRFYLLDFWWYFIRGHYV